MAEAACHDHRSVKTSLSQLFDPDDLYQIGKFEKKKKSAPKLSNQDLDLT